MDADIVFGARRNGSANREGAAATQCPTAETAAPTAARDRRSWGMEVGIVFGARRNGSANREGAAATQCPTADAAAPTAARDACSERAGSATAAGRRPKAT